MALVKPQFEAGKAEADRGQGVIRDPAVHQRVVTDITACATALPTANVLGIMDSPLTGADGNREFLLAVRKS